MIPEVRVEEACAVVALRGGEGSAASEGLIAEVCSILVQRPQSGFVTKSDRLPWTVFTLRSHALMRAEVAALNGALRRVLPLTCRRTDLYVASLGY